MPSLPVRPIGGRRKGSALILSLLFIGVIAISVAAMLSSVRYLARSANDKMAMEDCYQTALSGINLARAYVMQPNLAAQQAKDPNVDDAFQAILNGALAASDDIRANRTNSRYVNMSWETLRTYYNSASLNRFGQDHRGRKILHEWSGTNKFLVIPNGDLDGGEPSTAVVNASASEARSWIERLTITSPYIGQDDMRFVSFIIEVEAMTRNAGVTKRRILTSKVLAIPGARVEEPPFGLAQSMAAVVSGGGVNTINGNNSNMSIHWGPVWSKGNINVLGLEYTPATTGNKPKPNTLELALNKYTGIGAPDEKWVKWQTGVGATLRGKQDAYIFPQNGINGVGVTDFFGQVQTGAFNTADGPYEVTLSNFSPSNVTAMDPVTNKPLYYSTNTSGTTTLGDGAFVQNSASVNAKIDALYASLNYSTWKNFAIQRKGYIRPSNAAGSSFVNETGQKLYVTPQKTLTTNPTEGTPLSTDFLKQLSMRNLVPSNGLTSNIDDNMLFIDSVEGTEAGTTRLSLNINSSDNFFWKGMLWHHGDIEVGGGGSFPTIWGQNPDQFGKVAPNPNDSSTGTAIEKCMFDGILRVSGNVINKGNPALFGSLVAGNGNTGNFSGTGTWDIYYNPRVGQGIFAPPGGGAGGENSPSIQGLVGGPIAELDLVG